MSKGNRTPQRHRTLWISDVHLGSPSSQAKRLTEFLRNNECDQLYLVGDIFDGWKLKSRFYWTPDHTRVIRAIIAKARRGTKVHYLSGNHDSFMRQFIRNKLRLGHIRLANETIHTTADGRRLLVTHGDVFDAVTTGHPWIAQLGMIGYEALIQSNTWINQWRRRLGLPPAALSTYTKSRVKTLVEYLSGFDEAVVYRCKQDGLNGLVYGHTHQAEVRYLKQGIVCYNCGDWVESCTALREDFEGRIEIVRDVAVSLKPTLHRPPRSIRQPHVPARPVPVVVPPQPAPAPTPMMPPPQPANPVENVLH